MRLSAGIIRKRVENPEGGRTELEAEPGGGCGFLLNEGEMDLELLKRGQAMRAPTVASAKVSGGSGDVIAGPALAAQPVPQAAKQDSADLKADLEHLFAVRDGDFQRHRTGQAAGEDATQPMFLSTEPAKL